MEPPTPAGKPSALLTELETRHAGIDGAETGGVRNRVESEQEWKGQESEEQKQVV